MFVIRETKLLSPFVYLLYYHSRVKNNVADVSEVNLVCKNKVCERDNLLEMSVA